MSHLTALDTNVKKTPNVNKKPRVRKFMDGFKKTFGKAQQALSEKVRKYLRRTLFPKSRFRPNLRKYILFCSMTQRIFALPIV